MTTSSRSRSFAGFVSIIFMLLLSNFGQAQEDYWQQFVHYKMDLTLVPIEHALLGEEQIYYRNNSPDTLRQFFLHLYPNTFRDNNSTQAQEARRYNDRLVKGKDAAGYIRIESFRLLNTSNSDSVVVNAYGIDDTILKVNLPTPLPPGGELTLELSFYLKVWQHNGRAGYRGVQYDFAQWYPKVCVYDQTGWNAEPFHYLGEFYGEFGTFDVTIHTPFEYVVGATGVVVEGDPGWEVVRVEPGLSAAQWANRLAEIQETMREGVTSGEVRTVRFVAENVHDFAWSACADFLYEGGEWDGIPIHVLYRSSVRPRWTQRILERSQRGLAWLSEKFGRYPYPQVTVVHGLLGGGMEYPMLVMNNSERESLILHELGHIYFYGILANNEWKEAWLDEGFTTFQTRWYMESRYGKWGFDNDAVQKHGTWLQKHRPLETEREAKRNELLAYQNSGFDAPMSHPAHLYNEPDSYNKNAYTKGAFFYDMLRYVVGDSAFAEICRTYFERWKFKHVTGERFRHVCEDVSGMNLEWFFKQWLTETPKIDYAIHSVKKQRVGDQWQTEVTILKKETGTMPVEVALITTENDTVIQRWDGFNKVGQAMFVTRDKPDRVVLDPQDAILDMQPQNSGGFAYEVHFEYPNMAYTPRRNYLITWRPGGWYNSVDQLRIGGRLRGSYGVTRNALLGAWYGTDSKELDFKASYSNPVKPLGARTRGSVMAQKMEGRLELDTHLNFVASKYLKSGPQHRFVVGLNYSKLLEDGEAYVQREFDRKQNVTLPTWEQGEVYKAYLRYAVDPRGLDWFATLMVGLDVVEEDWGSDFTYNAIFTDIRFSFPDQTEGIFLRLFGKKISSEEGAPLQDLIYLDGANPRQRFQRFYLRSDGAMPAELHYHLPGDGNVRGFYNNPIVGDQIWAANVEVRKHFKFPSIARNMRSRPARTTLVAFSDLASLQYQESGTDFFMDAGIGLRYQLLLPDKWYTIFTGGRNLTLRLDFPFWVNKPLPDEEELRFRWVFGFEQTF